MRYVKKLRGVAHLIIFIFFGFQQKAAANIQKTLGGKEHQEGDKWVRLDSEVLGMRLVTSVVSLRSRLPCIAYGCVLTAYEHA